jgi:molybdopterin-guanine dinucleotide biosynthesis adapter protein
MKIFGFAGWSGSGKTTLIEKLIPLFVNHGFKVSLIKHAHHSFEVDLPGKDSWRHRRAGCSEVLVSSSKRWVLMHELRGAPEPGFGELIQRVSPCDLLLVEGFKREKLPKLEIYRGAVGAALLHPQDPDIVAIASDQKLETKLSQFHLDDAPAISAFILKHVGLA